MPFEQFGTFCFLIHFRYPGYHEINGDYSTQYWYVMVLRFMFALSLYYIIGALRTVMGWTVADEPWNVKLRRKRTIYLIKKLFKNRFEVSSGVKAA